LCERICSEMSCKDTPIVQLSDRQRQKIGREEWTDPGGNY